MNIISPTNGINSVYMYMHFGRRQWFFTWSSWAFCPPSLVVHWNTFGGPRAHTRTGSIKNVHYLGANYCFIHVREAKFREVHANEWMNEHVEGSTAVWATFSSKMILRHYAGMSSVWLGLSQVLPSPHLWNKNSPTDDLQGSWAWQHRQKPAAAVAEYATSLDFLLGR